MFRVRLRALYRLIEVVTVAFPFRLIVSSSINAVPTFALPVLLQPV